MSDRRVRVARIGLVVAAFALLPAFATSGYRLRVLTLMVGFALFAMALNVVFGHTDQLFLVVGGLAGVGGYGTVYSAIQLGVTPWATLPLGMLIAGALGGVVSYIAAKRRFTVILIAIFTLALQLALTQFFNGARAITGATDGLVVPSVFIESRLSFYYVFVLVLLVFMVGYDRLVHSRYGLALEAIREDELAAASSGIDVVRFKTATGFVGAVMIGLVGALYGFSEGRLFPAIYAFSAIDVLVLIMLTLGGMRTMLGPVVGAVLIYAIDEFLANYGGWRTFVFGVLLIVLFLYFRRGIVPRVAELVEDYGGDWRPSSGEGT